MSSPLLPLTLAAGAAAADGAGLHRLAFYVVLLAIPAAAAAALAAAGDLAEGRRVAVRVVCTGAALALLVTSSAVRANVAVGGSPPPIALSTLVACIGAYALLGLLWLMWSPQPEPQPQQ